MLVRLTVVPNEIEAELLCGLLRSNGIDCSYRRTDMSAAIVSQSLSAGGFTEVLVDERDLVRARAVTEDVPG